MNSKRATKETGTRISRIAAAMQAKTHEIRSLISVANNLRRAGQCQFCASCVKCHLYCHELQERPPARCRWSRSLWPRTHGTEIAWLRWV